MEPQDWETPEDCAPSLTFALQTLLARHEAYMASAERDRVELIARIELLEHENMELETKNRLAADENQSLREELEHLNDTVKDADARIESLEATLRDSVREVRRLENAANRAASLERQIAMLEEEQSTLQTTLVHTQEEARTAMFRWRQAEKGISDLQEQLERMEKEAREERERHVEVIGRMERQRAMERELNTAAGRLKGAAAVKSMTDSKHSGGVVSQFVRDLLQDNANLQLGMAELRELLVSSNDEIQMLREQLLYHQPLEAAHSMGQTSTLRAELEQKEPPTSPARVSQEFHIHHHYHVTQKPDVRRPKKKRQSLTAGTFTPPHISAPSTPVAHAMQRWHAHGSLPTTARNEVEMRSRGRWTIVSDAQSDVTASSAPSSPPSNPRNSLFDRVELSLPNSPTTSLDPMSPAWRTSHRKRPSEASARSITAPSAFPNLGLQLHGQSPQNPLAGFIREEEVVPNEHTDPYTRAMVLADDDAMGTVEMDAEVRHRSVSGEQHAPGRLRRIASHESIVSLSHGLDIHTLKARPSQLSLRPLGLTAAGTNISAVTAHPTIAKGTTGGRGSNMFLRDSLATVGQVPKQRNGGRVVSDGASRPTKALSRLASWRPWGGGSNQSPLASPVASSASSTITTTEALTTVSSPTGPDASPLGSVALAASFRAPGINQPGVIPGFNEWFAAHQRRGPPSKVSVDDLGQVREAMREVLEEE